MASRRRKAEGESLSPNNTPTQEDDADILAEVGAVRDEENGGYTVDEDKLRELGVADAASLRENRRLDRVIDKKRKGEKDVTWGTNDPLIIYESILRMAAPDSINIRVKRLTGSEVVQMITSRPLSGAELYAAICAVHGQQPEAEYEIKFTEAGRGKYRGTGRIIMPDTRVTQQQGQQPMSNQNGQGYQPQYVQQQPQPAPAPQQQQPTVQVMPASFDPNSMMSMMGQMFEMFRTMQKSAQPPPPPPPVQQQPQYQAASPQMQMPPPPPPQSSPAEQMAWMQQAFGLFQQAMQAAPQPPATPQWHPAPAPVQQPPPPPPPPSPQAGLAESMEVMGQMFEMFQRMQRQASPASAPGGPYRGPRPPYYPQGDQDQGRSPPYQSPPPQQPPQRQQSPAEQLREAMGVVRTAVDAVREMNSLLPDQQHGPATPEPEEDDSPVRVVDTGPIKLAINKEDGALRWADTGMMALPGVLKWLGEQREAIQKEAAQRQRLQQPPQQQQLPPGFVEVHPGYQPPPGFVAVPVDQPLPPPPVNVPPPIQSAPPRQSWGAPTIPEEEEEEDQ